MSAPQTDGSAVGNTAAVETLAQKTARVIEDPFGSVIAGILTPAAAVGVVVSAIYGLALVY